MNNLTAIAKQANAYYNDVIPAYKHQPINDRDAEMLFAINRTRMAINNAANSNAPEQCVDELKSHIEMLLRYISNGDAFEMHMLATKALQIVVALNTAWDVLTNKPSKIDRTSTAPY